MKVKERDVVTLNDDLTYAVVSKIIYKGETYFCFGNHNNPGKFKILKENEKNGKLLEITNQDLIQKLLPLFLKDSINILNCTVPEDDDDDDFF